MVSRVLSAQCWGGGEVGVGAREIAGASWLSALAQTHEL